MIGGGFVSVYCDKIKIICTSGYYKNKIIKIFLRELLLLVRVSRVGCGGVREWGRRATLILSCRSLGSVPDLAFVLRRD